MLRELLIVVALSPRLHAAPVGPTARDSDNLRPQGSGSTPATVVAQTDADEIRRRVKEGQKIVMVDDQGRELTGRVGELRADALILLVGRNSTDVPYERILRIDRPRDRLWDGALTGFGIGAGLGLLAPFVIAANNDSAWSGPSASYVALFTAPLFGGIGAGIGVGLDALIRREPNLYRRQGGSRISWSPALGRERRGVAFSVSW